MGLATLLLLVVARRPLAHEVPASVTVLAIMKPAGDRLKLVVRIPLESVRDVQFPLRGPGYLDVERVTPLLPDAARLWIVQYLTIYERDVQLPDARIVAARVSLPSDRSFVSYDRALAHVLAPPLAPSTDLHWQQAMLDVLIEYPIASDRSPFSVRSELAHLGVRTATVLRFLSPDGRERAFQWMGNPGLVRLDPRWYQAALRFVEQGFFHILGGTDHLLFILCLVVPFRRFRSLVAIVTAFTVAHSITLIAAALGFAPGALWFPPLIETLIALSIVLMALENIAGARPEWRWLIAFVFGLVHGFGFSFVLRQSLQFAGSHLLTSLLAFNAGVELGQVLVLAVTVPLLGLVFRRVVAERAGTIILSALVAHTAWHWMTERGSALLAYDFELPALDAAFAVAAMRGAMLLLVALAALWFLRGVFERFRRGDGESEAVAGPFSEVPPVRSADA